MRGQPQEDSPITAGFPVRFRPSGAGQVEGQPVTPGMKGKVLSLHDGFHLDVAEVEPIPPRARVQFESGMALVVDARMRWEKAN